MGLDQLVEATIPDPKVDLNLSREVLTIHICLKKQVFLRAKMINLTQHQCYLKLCFKSLRK